MTHVESYYDTNSQLEWEREDRHPTEFAVTRRALAEYLPPPPARLLDCGGGPGRYAIPLACQGYAVTLFDLSNGNLALARQKAEQAGAELCGFVQGSALDLGRFADGSFDAVLLLGPLYHLVRAEDRRLALSEALRVLRPGGCLLASFITIFAPFRDAIAKGYTQQYSADPAQTRELLETHIIRPGETGGFTDAWFAHPAEVIPLMEAAGQQEVASGQQEVAGLRTLALLGVEGLAAGHEQHLRALDPAGFEFWADLNYRFSREPSLLGAADHLLYVGMK
jgi:ubiquinone/menaquinone biosynthesis C-methylase UbiE